MQIFVATTVLAILIAFYLISWKLNRKQQLPAEVQESLKSCDACNIKGCGHHPEQRGTENE